MRIKAPATGVFISMLATMAAGAAAQRSAGPGAQEVTGERVRAEGREPHPSAMTQSATRAGQTARPFRRRERKR
jgi:hypothetical protein